MDAPINPSSPTRSSYETALERQWLIKDEPSHHVDLGCHFTLEIKAFSPKMIELLETGSLTLGSVYQGLYNLIKDKDCKGLELDRDTTHGNKLHVLAAAFLCVLRKYENQVRFYNVKTKDSLTGEIQYMSRVHIGDDNLGLFDPDTYRMIGGSFPEGIYRLNLRTQLTPRGEDDGLEIIMGTILTVPVRGPADRQPLGVLMDRQLRQFPVGTNPWSSLGEAKPKGRSLSLLRGILM
ncbi:M [Maize mosaic nucleorhabdovirus]|uniref:Matrix protein n=2 Tax=Maize mosaic virus TaxID=279896 RepID=MATRX_MMVR|nr:M [Maize mosaic nucleorhabdovirus] [Maize mosaic nucleorhabdovirus]Q6E0W8.1 RecName: Full=Matrix protein [Maize mosaic virus maize/USA/Reed/2005]AAT66755.1 M [Maize mosaic nucleorhabdovirus] [Maize mosaic nucleorhabdovirus]QCS90260.1 matrix protein [Maize mosaic nucleorhabdovirus]